MYHWGSYVEQCKVGEMGLDRVLEGGIDYKEQGGRARQLGRGDDSYHYKLHIPEPTSREPCPTPGILMFSCSWSA